MQLTAPFDELAAWISDNWNVTVLNVIYDRRDRLNSLHYPRIQVILEHSDDAESFYISYCNPDKNKQTAIASKFIEIINRKPNHGYDVNGLFVIFSAFAPIALDEADEKIPEKDIDALKHQIDNPDLWTIKRGFGKVIFMFYTDAQAEEYTAKGMKTEYASQYFELLKAHDEFGYFSEDKFDIQFDSKQNFDENYSSNWAQYFR